MYSGMRSVSRLIFIAALVTASVVPALAAPRAGDDGAGFIQVRGGGGWRGGDHDRAREGVNQGRLLPLEAILSNIARSYPGNHIGVEGPFEQGGRLVYRVKWLTPDGRVMIIFADAETGQILGQRGGR